MAVLVLFAPVAYARNHKAALRPVYATAPMNLRTGKKMHAARSEPRKAKGGVRKEKVISARANDSHRRHKAGASKLHLRSQSIVAASPPQPSEPVQPKVHVTHNRKEHLSPQPAPENSKPTAEDFLSSVSSAPISGSKLKNGSSSANVVDKQSVAAKPVSVISVIRQTTERPQLPTIEEQATTPLIMPALFYHRGHLVMPPALRGTHEILVHQNAMADQDGLARIQDDDDLIRMRETKQLVTLPSNATIQTDERLSANRRYCRPWTAQFLTALARAHYERFHSPLQVNSAVRTVEFQQRLQRTNGNAAPAEGETASPHLTGQAVDLAKHGLSQSEIAWLRGYLLPLVQEGKIDVEEEFQQACFHVSVYRRYDSQAAPKHLVAQTYHGTESTLAAATP